jgi:hypothetical protein
MDRLRQIHWQDNQILNQWIRWLARQGLGEPSIEIALHNLMPLSEDMLSRFHLLLFSFFII